jgi:hypothetical protein
MKSWIIVRVQIKLYSDCLGILLDGNVKRIRIGLAPLDAQKS